MIYRRVAFANLRFNDSVEDVLILHLIQTLSRPFSSPDCADADIEKIHQRVREEVPRVPGFCGMVSKWTSVLLSGMDVEHCIEKLEASFCTKVKFRGDHASWDAHYAVSVISRETGQKMVIDPELEAVVTYEEWLSEFVPGVVQKQFPVNGNVSSDVSSGGANMAMVKDLNVWKAMYAALGQAEASSHSDIFALYMVMHDLNAWVDYCRFKNETPEKIVENLPEKARELLAKKDLLPKKDLVTKAVAFLETNMMWAMAGMLVLGALWIGNTE